MAPSSFFSFSSFSSSSSVYPGIQTVPSTMLPPRYATSDALLYYGRRFAYQFDAKEIKKNPFALLLCLLEYSNTVPYFFRVMDSRKCPPPDVAAACFSRPSPHINLRRRLLGVVLVQCGELFVRQRRGGDGKARAGAEPMMG